MGLRSKIRKAFEIWGHSGWAGVRRRIRWNRWKSIQRNSYERWLRVHGALTETQRSEMRGKVAGFASRPLISVLLPVYNVDEEWLRLCLDSVLDQIYPHWELCVADDCSTKPHVRTVLEEYAGRDDRVKVHFRGANGHISAASNSALELATGEFAVLLDHDDELSEDALFWVAKELEDHPRAAMIYSDEDMIDTDGRRYSPNFKPDFSYDLMLSINLVTHLSAYRTELLRSIGGFRIGLEGSQDYDLALRAIERISVDQIRHIPRILYHWRAIPGSVALNSDEKPYAHEKARVAIREHLVRMGIKAEVSATQRNFHRARYELPDPPPRVSIIVDARGRGPDIADLLSNTDYPSFEVVLISGEGRAIGAWPNVHHAVCAEPRRAARLNFAVRRARGEICVFVAESAAPRDKEWLTELVRFFARDEIGAVGGRVVGPDETVLDGGLILGANGADVAFGGYPTEFPGMTARNDVIGNFSAVSESCLAVRKKHFDRGGGFDDQNLPNALFAADLCLKLAERGLRLVLTPYAELRSFGEGIPAWPPTAAELRYFKGRWPRQTAADPFYNPNLSIREGTFTIDA